MSVTPLRRRQASERGQTLAIFALFLIVLLGISALAVDYGTWLLSHRSYQNFTDAAALDGVSLLTRPLSDQCAVGKTKAVCAREAAWTSVRKQLNLPGLVAATQAASNTTDVAPYTELGYRIWVDTPPTAAGTKYTGSYSDSNHIFVRVERENQTFFGRIFGQTNATVSAWSTAGLLANRYAIVALCPKSARTSDCPQAQDIKLSGTNTGVRVIDGDVGSNWGLTVTSGTAPGLILPGDSAAYIVDYNTCGPSTWLCPPSAVGGIQDGGSPPAAKAAQQMVVPATDPAYPLPSWIDDSTAVPGRPNANITTGSPVNATANNVSCAPGSPEIGPGNYARIDVANGACLILNPTLGLTAGQRPGIFRITDRFNIANDAFVIGDGVSLFIDSTVAGHFSVGNDAGLVINNGNVTSGQTRGAWTTAGQATWPLCSAPLPCTPSYNGVVDGVGMAFYIRKRTDGSATSIFNMSGSAGLLFRGALYGPKDAVGIGGNSAQHSAGIIVGYTIFYNGTTTLDQIYEGPADERPFLVEPTLGQ